MKAVTFNLGFDNYGFSIPWSSSKKSRLYRLRVPNPRYSHSNIGLAIALRRVFYGALKCSRRIGSRFFAASNLFNELSSALSMPFSLVS